MAELKIYVMDHGWSGADIYVTDSEEDARNHFLGTNLEDAEERLALHMQAHPDQSPNPWIEQVDYWKTGKYWKDIDVYPVERGTYIYTIGDN